MKLWRALISALGVMALGTVSAEPICPLPPEFLQVADSCRLLPRAEHCVWVELVEDLARGGAEPKKPFGKSFGIAEDVAAKLTPWALQLILGMSEPSCREIWPAA